MFKRFVMGFIVGIAAMYWYIHSGEGLIADMYSWINGSAAKYRGDSKHQAIDRQVR